MMMCKDTQVTLLQQSIPGKALFSSIIEARNAPCGLQIIIKAVTVMEPYSSLNFRSFNQASIPSEARRPSFMARTTREAP